MSFVPPLFSKFGKTASDLLTQKWEVKKGDFKNQASIKSKSQGVTITSTAIEESKPLTSVSGKVNVKYEDRAFGEVTGEVNTFNKLKATTKLTKLYPGLTVNAETDVQDSNKNGKATVEYATAPVAVSAEYNCNKVAVVSGAFGYEAFSFGASASVDINKLDNKQDAVNLEAGVQYEDGNLIGTLKVEKNYNIAVSLYHRVNAALQLASKVSISGKDNSTAVVVGGQYKYNDATLVKAKVDVKSDQSYVASTFLEHRLKNPNVVVGVSNQLSAKDNFVGVNFAFGEY